MNSKGTILVIEDDEAIQVLIRSILISDGYKVVSAYEGVSGLFEISLTKPDAILLDMGLPLMDGESFFRAYQQTPEPHVPVIGMSAYIIEPKITASMAGFIKKPFDVSKLRNTVNAALGNFSAV